MLDDHEQRALEELERHYDADVGEPVASRRSDRRASRPPGIRVVAVMGCVSVVLLIAGTAAAALAVAAATAMGWLSWRLWVLRADGGAAATSLLLGAGPGRSGSAHRPGESIRQYLRWLVEGE